MNLPVVVYTDGSCLKDGTGAWACSIRRNGESWYHLAGIEGDTTNNRMELTAVCKALEQTSASDIIHLYSDSMYVLDGIRLASRWCENGWKNNTGKDIRNKDLWMKYLQLSENFTIKGFHVKGHSGVVENEVVDSLAASMYTRQ